MLTLKTAINDRAVLELLNQAAQKLSNPAPLMRQIAARFESLTQEAFRVQGVVGGSRWQTLAAATIHQRSRGKHPSWPGQILNIRGGRGLLGSVHAGSSRNAAWVGAGSAQSAAYAAIHQFGGTAGRGRKTRIPARPYLPFSGNADNAQLTHAAARSVEQLALYFLQR